MIKKTLLALVVVGFLLAPLQARAAGEMEIGIQAGLNSTKFSGDLLGEQWYHKQSWGTSPFPSRRSFRPGAIRRCGRT